MRFGMMVAVAAALAGPAIARTEYRVEPGIDQAAQLAELLSLYDSLCLTAFPNDGAVFQKVVALGKTKPLTGPVLDEIFHGDPGIAWAYEGKSGRFTIAVEAPPFHACTVRTMTAGFGETKAYRTIAERYEKKAKGFHAVDLLDRTDGDIRTVLAGEQRETQDGGTDALLILVTTPASEERRQAGETGVDVRLVHQIAKPEGDWPKRQGK